MLEQGHHTSQCKTQSNIKTPKSNYIFRKAERALLNEKVRLINNSITMFMYQRDTCIDQLKRIFGKKSIKECKTFIKDKRESRYFKTLETPEIKI